MSEQDSRLNQHVAANVTIPAAAPQAEQSSQISAVLTAITEMMADSDRRQTAAMQEMQERIDNLSATTRRTGAGLPPQLHGAFKQIEDAIAGLAKRIGRPDTGPPRRGAAAFFTRAAPGPANLAAAPVATVGPGRHEQALAKLTSMLGAEATATLDPAYASPPGNKAAPPPETLGRPGNPEEPWDNDSAEKLMRLYEAGEAGLPALQTASTDREPSRPGQHPLGPQAAIARPAAMTSDDRTWLSDQLAVFRADIGGLPRDLADTDKDWLSAQFSRIADHLAAELHRADQSGLILETMDNRLSNMEQRVLDAFAAVSSDHNSAALKDVEACIRNFTSQLEKSQSELARLTSIENDIRDLATRLSQDRLMAMMAPIIDNQQSVDSQQIAEFVASYVADRSSQKIAEALPAATDDTGRTSELLASVKGLLDNLIVEQRTEGKHTADRLETLHQSLEKLLDRVDKLERPAAPAQPARTSNDVAAAGPRTSAAPPPANRKAEQPAQSAPQLRAQPERRQSAPQPSAHGGRDFLSEARRAAAKANARLQQQGHKFELTNDATNQDAAEPASPIGKTRSAAGQGETKSSLAGVKRSPVRLALAVVALLAIGFGGANLVFGWTDYPKPPTNKAQAPDQTKFAAGKPIVPAAQSGSLPDGGATATPSPGRTTTELLQRGFPAGGAITPPATGLTADQIKRHDDAQESAALSTKVGASQPVAAATPAALVPPAPMPAAGARATGQAASPLNHSLPSALIGPLSLRLAAANGDPSASFEVAARYAEGKGVAQNFEEAVKWYGKSAGKGFALAQYRLATLYERGFGVTQDFARAKIWYERSARQGNIKAMHNLAVLLASGKVGDTDYGAATRWFGEAAERGLADSQFNLAILYENGLGVSKDLAQAYKWFALAAHNGDGDADRRRRGLINKLNSATVAEADKTVAQWRRRAISRLSNDPHFAGNQWQHRTSANSRS